jgi:hypothetical protein
MLNGDNIKIYLAKIRLEKVDYIHVAQEEFQIRNQ